MNETTIRVIQIMFIMTGSLSVLMISIVSVIGKIDNDMRLKMITSYVYACTMFLLAIALGAVK